MQHPPRTTSPLAHGPSTCSSSSSAITSSWHIQRQSENTVDVFGDDYDTSPFDETALANNGLSPLSVANQSPLRLETAVDWEDEEDPFADCYHPHSRLPRPASASAPASSAGPSGLVSRPTSSRPAPVVPKRGGAYGRYADSSSRARRHHQTTPSTMTSSANGLRKPQTPMQMLYDLPYTPSSTPSASPNSRRRATLPSPPPVPARPRVVEPDAPLVVHGTRPSPFPLGPTPPRRTGRAAAMASKPVPVHIVDVAVERFGLQLQTPSTAPSSAASSSTDSSDDTELVTPTTTIASSSPVTTSAITTTSGMMRRKPAVTALDMERERQWALWEAEHAPSATIVVTEPVEKKKLFSISSSKSSTVEPKQAKPTKDNTKKRSSRWWCCFGGSSAHDTDDEEEWNVEHEKSPRPASRLRKRAI